MARPAESSKYPILLVISIFGSQFSHAAHSWGNKSHGRNLAQCGDFAYGGRSATAGQIVYVSVCAWITCPTYPARRG